MKYSIHQAIVLAGKTYLPGVREVPDQVAEKDPHFLHFVKAGYIGEADQVAPKQRSNKERTEALIKTINEGLAAKKAAAPEKAAAPAAPVSVASASVDDDVHTDVPMASKKKSKP